MNAVGLPYRRLGFGGIRAGFGAGSHRAVVWTVVAVFDAELAAHSWRWSAWLSLVLRESERADLRFRVHLPAQGEKDWNNMVQVAVARRQTRTPR